MRNQTLLEEKLNTITHLFGAVLGVFALYVLLHNNTQKTPYSTFSLLLYSCSIILLFSSSTIYHFSKNKRQKRIFRTLDHISIYFLIAGTYSPVCLILLPNSLGWQLFFLVWGIALFGIFLKLFFTGKCEVFSLLLYVIMGWLIVFDWSALTQQLTNKELFYLVAGGLTYTLGIVFYVIDKIPFNHVIWHLFVLAGVGFHFAMVLSFI